MQFKEGVDKRGVHPRLWTILPWVDRLHQQYTGQEVTWTSLRRPWAPDVNSKHSPISPPQRDVDWFDHEQWDRFFVSAANGRRWALDAAEGVKVRKVADVFCRHIQAVHGDELGVVLEPDWLTDEQIAERGGIENIAPHFHLQLKFPVRWELWI